MKVLRKIVEIDEELCDGCGECIPSCAEGALEIVDGKARIIEDKLCDGLGACLGECPLGALKIVERETDEFDEEAVHEHLAARGDAHIEPAEVSGCPSAAIQTFAPADASGPAIMPSVPKDTDSALSHWPVKIRLIPPTAPFLKGADLLVLADCVPAAFPRLHEELLKDKAVAMGCPKFDDAEGYIAKFAEIFQTAGINSITTVIMEVPCCAGLDVIVRRGLDASGKKIPMENVVISTRGQILERVRVV